MVNFDGNNEACVHWFETSGYKVIKSEKGKVIMENDHKSIVVIKKGVGEFVSSKMFPRAV